MPPAADAPAGPAAQRAAVRAEIGQVRADFRCLVTGASATDLRRSSDGTKWTNQQLLFHMLFGYLVTRALLGLVRIFGLLPGPVGKAFAQTLDAAHRPVRLRPLFARPASTFGITLSRMYFTEWNGWTWKRHAWRPS